MGVVGLRTCALLGLVLAGTAGPGEAPAQDKACAMGMVRQAPQAPLLRFAAAPPAALRFGQLELTYLGHSAYLIRTPGGATAVTDYNGSHGPGFPPDVATMNNSHISHYTPSPDPRIRHVLRGWDPAGGIADHDLRVKDMRVFNVPTNLLDWSGRQTAGNSIFVFEASAICVAHLGHLHHVLTDGQQEQLRRVDVLMAPIDGRNTIGYAELMRVIDQIGPKVILPMHFHFPGAVPGFIAAVAGRFPVRHLQTQALVLDRRELPPDTEAWFLRPRVPGGWGGGGDF